MSICRDEAMLNAAPPLANGGRPNPRDGPESSTVTPAQSMKRFLPPTWRGGQPQQFRVLAGAHQRTTVYHNSDTFPRFSIDSSGLPSSKTRSATSLFDAAHRICLPKWSAAWIVAVCRAFLGVRPRFYLSASSSPTAGPKELSVPTSIFAVARCMAFTSRRWYG